MKIETYNSNVLPDATPQPTGPIEMGNSRGTAALAQGLDQLGSATTRLAVRQQEEDDHLWSMNAMTEFRQQHMRLFEDAKDNAPDGADGFTKDQNDQFESNMKLMLETAPTKRSRQLAEMQAREFQQSYFAHSLQFESAERQRNRFQQHVDGAKAESNEIDLAASPLDAYLQLVPARLKLIAGSGGDPSARQKIADGVSNHYSKTLVLADARRDPAGTLAKIDDGTYSKLVGWNLYGDQLEMLRRGVEARVNHRDSGESAVIRDAITEWVERVKRAEYDPNTGKMTPPPEFAYDDARVEKALGPVAYKNWKEKKQVLPIVMEIGARIPLMGPKEISETRAKFKADVNSGKVSAEFGNAAESALDDIIRNVTKERREDPATAAQRAAAGLFGETYTNGTHADQLSARVMVQKGIFGLQDHEVRLLGKEELKDTVRKLKDMTPDGVQAYLRELPEQINQSLKNAKIIQGKHEAFNPEKMSSLYMAELFQQGGLNKEYLWTNFSSNQHYGNTLLAATRAKEAELAKALPKEQVVDLNKQIETNETLGQFTRIISASAGPEGADYIGSLQSLVTKAAMIAMQDPNKPQIKNVVDAIVKDVIDDQISLNGTYYVPKQDPLTHRPLDHKKIDEQLKLAGDNWTKANGDRFVPVIHTKKTGLQGSQTHTDGSLNPRDGTYVWLSNSDGSGVYRAVRLMGSAQGDQPGAYAAVLDGNKQRYEVLFKDLEMVSGYAKAHASAPRRISAGSIRGK